MYGQNNKKKQLSLQSLIQKNQKQNQFRLLFPLSHKWQTNQYYCKPKREKKGHKERHNCKESAYTQMEQYGYYQMSRKQRAKKQAQAGFGQGCKELFSFGKNGSKETKALMKIYEKRNTGESLNPYLAKSEVNQIKKNIRQPGFITKPKLRSQSSSNLGNFYFSPLQNKIMHDSVNNQDKGSRKIKKERIQNELTEKRSATTQKYILKKKQVKIKDHGQDGRTEEHERSLKVSVSRNASHYQIDVQYKKQKRKLKKAEEQYPYLANQLCFNERKKSSLFADEKNKFRCKSVTVSTSTKDLQYWANESRQTITVNQDNHLIHHDIFIAQQESNQEVSQKEQDKQKNIENISREKMNQKRTCLTQEQLLDEVFYLRNLALRLYHEKEDLVKQRKK